MHSSGRDCTISSNFYFVFSIFCLVAERAGEMYLYGRGCTRRVLFLVLSSAKQSVN